MNYFTSKFPEIVQMAKGISRILEPKKAEVVSKPLISIVERIS